MKTRKITAFTVAGALLLTAMLSACAQSGDNSQNVSEVSQSGGMRDITSAELVKEMGIGWNLGNTLDVCQADRDGDGIINERADEGEEVDETLWGNLPATPELFDFVKSSGVNSVRIPITWRDHLDENDNIKESWMDRVQEVVDYAIDRGMYVIINMHHDGGGDPEFGAWIREYAARDYDKFYARYSKMWKQIAERFKDYDDHLIFESMNEVGFDDLPENEAFALLNKINRDFVDIIRDTGGNNAKRHLLIAGYWTDIAETCKPAFQMPNDTIDDHLILSVHYYTPWQFCIAGSQKTWGTDAEMSEMRSKMDLLKTNFVDKGVPVIIGEYAGGGSAAEETYFCENLANICAKMDVPCFLWDNGGKVNRNTLEWYNPKLIEGLNRAVTGEEYEIVKS